MSVFHRGISIGTASAIAVIVVAAWFTLSKIEADVRVEAGTALTTVLSTTQQAVHSWVDEHRRDARIWANTDTVRRLTQELLALPSESGALLSDPAQTELRHFLHPVYTGMGYRGYFVIGPGNVSLSSSRDSSIGSQNLLVHQPEALERLWAGMTVLSVPQRSDVPLPDESGRLTKDHPTMFVGAPIRDGAGKVVALLTFRIDPGANFTTILQRGRIGETGETYAFNRNGRLISQSRFDEQLKQIGLIGPDKRGILNIEIRDPGVDLTEGALATLPRPRQPLTRMAESALAGKSESDLGGYRDYRGVPVIGAWLWDDELNLGIATEINVDEIYNFQRTTRVVFLVFTLVAIVALVALAWFQEQSRRRQTQQEARYRSLFEHANDAIFIVDPETRRLLDVNMNATRRLGYSRDELLRMTIDDISASSDPNRNTAVMQQLMEKGRVVFEHRHRRRNGIAIPVEISSRLTKYGNQTVIQSIVRDITERKKSEADLVAAKDQAELANRAKSEFLANMSHELRTPLNAVIGFSDAMRGEIFGPLDKPYREYVDNIHASGEHLLDIINDILDVSAIEAGKLELHEEDVSAAGLIEKAARLVRPRAEGGQVRLDVGEQDSLPQLRVDERRMLQVLLNLLSNAIKFTPEGGSVTLTGEEVERNGFVFRVSDTGVGMARDEIDTALIPFGQVDGSLARRHEGTGLGLPLTKGLVELHGGILEIDSTEGQGTTATVHLPAERVSAS